MKIQKILLKHILIINKHSPPTILYFVSYGWGTLLDCIDKLLFPEKEIELRKVKQNFENRLKTLSEHIYIISDEIPNTENFFYEIKCMSFSEIFNRCAVLSQNSYINKMYVNLNDKKLFVEQVGLAKSTYEIKEKSWQQKLETKMYEPEER